MNLESLESRRLLSVSVTLDSNGLLTVTGTKKDDVVDLASEHTYLMILNAFGQEQDVDFSKVKAVHVDLMGGNDTFTMNDKILVPMTIIGGSGNDSLRGGGGDDVLIGGGGADSLCGGAGFDVADFSDLTTGVTFNMADATIEAVVGSQGNDSIIGSDSNDIILGEGGNDTLIGNGGDDYIDGGVGQDSMSGGPGDDMFLNFDGQPDTLDGGSGHNFAEQDSNDTFINIDQIFDQNPGGGNNSGGGSNSGGSNSGGTAANSGGNTAQPMVEVQHAALALAITADPPVATLTRGVLSIAGTSAADNISVILDSTGKNIDVSVNGASAVFSKASVTSISIDAGGGNDSVSLQRGDGSRAVTVPASILGSNGNDTIVGGAGDDTITGGNGNDVISGIRGNDSLQGAAGDDQLFGGDGNDYLNGGTSATTGPDGADLLSGGAGNDTALYISRTDNLSININDNKSNDGAAGEGDNVESDVENILSGTGNDTLTGNASANVLSGNAGNDIINGNGGHDKIIGGAGIDTLSNSGADATIFSLTDLGRDNFSSALNGSGLPTSDFISGDVGLDFSTTSGEILR